MSYSMTIFLMIMGPLTYISIWVICLARMEAKHRRHVASRERQAKLEAFWKEEQLRLNPPPKRISQHTSHLEDALWEMTLWDMRDNEERKSRAAGK